MNPAGGGPAESIRRSGLALQAQGHEVTVASLDPPNAPWLEGFELPVHALGTTPTGYGKCPGYVPWLHQHAGDFDAVIVSGLWQYQGYGARQALRGSSTPYFVFPHGMLDPWFKRRHPLKHLKKWLYWPWGEYRVLRDAAAVLFTCEQERSLARESFWLYRANERVVRYGTAAPTGDPELQRQQFLAAHPELAGKRLVLFLGRIHPKKGCDLLLQAFAEACSGDSPCHLVIAGPAEDTYLAELQNLAEKLGIARQVSWTGMLERDQKWGALHAAEVFVLPSHQENFGIAVAEAMASSKAVLISNQVNIWQEIQEARAGLVAPDTREGTVTLLTNWLRLTVDERAAMGQRARQCFADCFEIGKAATHLVETISEVLESRRKIPT